MTIKSNKDDDDNSKSKENVFQIMDGIIAQLNRAKKMFITMILTIMIIPPIAFAVTFALLGPPFHFDAGGRGPPEKFGPPPQIAVKYERYKELQKRVDEKLNYDNGGKEG